VSPVASGNARSRASLLIVEEFPSPGSVTRLDVAPVGPPRRESTRQNAACAHAHGSTRTGIASGKRPLNPRTKCGLGPSSDRDNLQLSPVKVRRGNADEMPAGPAIRKIPGCAREIRSCARVRRSTRHPGSAVRLSHPDRTCGSSLIPAAFGRGACGPFHARVPGRAVAHAPKLFPCEHRPF